jgi:PAS domain S-box-containing protein
VNPAAARAFGRPPDQIVGKNAGDLFPRELADRYYKDDLDVIGTGKPKLNIIEQMTDASGETRWVQTEKLPVLDENGVVTGVLLFVVDITDRKMAQDALALANKKLGLMSSITRHDILNQLTALNTYIELCRMASPSPEIAGHIKKLLKISSTIERHIKFTQDYQTIGMNEPIWQDVGGCIFRSVAALPLGHVQVTTDIHEVKVLADPLMEKIFYNLVENALRHGGLAMTLIHIYSEENGSGLKIIVEDNGNGIAPEDRPHLFTKGFGKNTGLGLFLSREILEITGMKIQENGTLGKGARFEISVPKGVYRIST